jgi:Domain of unknown function (DUF4440)
MSVLAEIQALEDRLKLAELGPDPKFFEEALADDAVIVSEGSAAFAKSEIVAAHQPGKGPKFTRVEMSDMRIMDHGSAAVVTCRGTYETSQGAFSLKFMRVWAKKPGGWRIVAGTVSKAE